MDDSVCTRCHADLSRYRISGGTARAVETVVTRFDTVHPREFATIPVDRAKSPRRVKFNHARHLADGITLEKGGAPFTFADLAETDRKRYGWKAGEKLDRPVRLTCAACHQLDADDAVTGSGRVTGSQTSPRQAGAYMLPVAYDRHCAACHSLAFDTHAPREQVRHGVQPGKVVEELERFYAARAVTADQAFLHQFVPPLPLPDRPQRASEQQLGEAIRTRVTTALRLFFGAEIEPAERRRLNLPQGKRGCVECHNLKRHSEPLLHSRDFLELEIEPVLMTPVWFERAFFNHTTHRALDCVHCHAGVESSRENGDLPLLPRRDVCTSCHTSEGSWWTGPISAASTACTACHRYHDGDHPGRGLGAAARRGAARFSAQQFRQGIWPAKNGESAGMTRNQTTR
jgi:hypothetical protein